MFRILYADDQLLMRTMVQELLMEAADVHSVELASDGAQAIDLSRQSHLDAVVLDIAMPGVNGIMALTTLHQERPSLPIIMLSTSTDEHTVRHCLKLGALGFVAKNSAYDELMLAIRVVVAGAPYLCRVVKASLARYP
jgi:DNA-binding NarL/FixJ family response regulator